LPEGEEGRRADFESLPVAVSNRDRDREPDPGADAPATDADTDSLRPAGDP